MLHRTLLSLLLVVAAIRKGQTFFVPSSSSSWRMTTRPIDDGATLIPSSALQQQSKNSYDGSEHGNVLLGLSLLASIWIFSIPPEFRRAYFCATPSCVQQRAACNDCVTFSEWKTQLGEYYRNGGGIQFDFSIDPKTKQFWADTLG
ncbi:hypothetical protein FisN_37Hu018 [Fistulifera solaris]|uniref:Uncharacterized protein n=1 Tax=Fistulifera solaris TaxID=1519565 RepID=A0A1Z5KK31_FISSO|nr:hypothetical protein FisN_37Hu018 [Fistulifera solaris]|eukprot:GAX26432.1 hypothetical protein FisN_37Hu018 [Fistulifera solaris]